jgi:hypothetical protein
MSSVEEFNMALQAGESSTVEFLSAVNMPKFVQTICAMANSEGGVIYVGVSDIPFASSTPRESVSQPAERSVVGVAPATVQRVTRDLRDHFDDPLPKLREEQIAHQGSKGPVIAVHVDRHSGSDQIALADLTIWQRNGSQNDSFLARSYPLRAKKKEDLTDNLQYNEQLKGEVVRASPSSSVQDEEKSQSPATTSDSVPPVQNSLLGSKSLFRREASPSESSLDADGYAEVIANLLRDADGSERMALAIFGHWGRGKTFLANRMAERLEANLTGRPRYKTVVFSAWKYRTTPEVWAYLFERILQEGKKEQFLLPLRASVVRHGPWPLIIAMFGLSYALSTKDHQMQSSGLILQIVSMGALSYGAFLYARLSSVAVRLRSLYAFTSHSDKLGLHAAIGDDLRALLRAWCQTDRKRLWQDSTAWWLAFDSQQGNWWAQVKRFWGIIKKWLLPCLLPCIFYVFAAMLIGWKLWPGKHEARVSVLISNDLSAGVHPYVELFFYTAWCAIWVITPFILFFSPLRSTDRVLLIVDDLDRCDPKQMLEIVESTMLILDDQEVHEQLQVCMLIDEIAFNHALLEKYRQLLKEEAVEWQHPYDAARIIRENVEKFFLIHIRLPALTDDEIAKVAETYVQQLRSVSSTIEQTAKAQVAPAMVQAPDTVQSTATTLPVPVEPPPIVDRKSVIEQEEADAIIECVKRDLRGEDREVVGPRALRCILFRYQLARDILSRLGKHPNPRELAKAVVAVYAKTTTDETPGSIIQNVVNQLS